MQANIIRGFGALSLLLGLTASGQTLVSLESQSKNANFSNATSTRPFKTGSVLPAICTVGEAFFNTSASAGSNVYGCTATNIWTLESVGSGGGSSGGAATGTLAQIQAMSCTPGSSPNFAVATDQAPGLNLYSCTSPNTWTLQQYQVSNGLALTGALLSADCNTVGCQGGANNFSAAGNSYVGRSDLACTNNASTGTTNNLLAKFDSAGNCVLAATSDTVGIIGVVASGGGTSTAAPARVARQGTVLCIADAAVTAGHYATIGTVTAGRCGDSSTRPSGGNEIIGVWTTSGSAGSLQTIALLLDSNSGDGGGGGSSGPQTMDVQTNVTGPGGTSTAFLTSAVPSIPGGKCERIEFVAVNKVSANGNTITVAFGGSTLFTANPSSIAAVIHICNQTGVQNAQNISWYYFPGNNSVENEKATTLDTSTSKNFVLSLSGTTSSDAYFLSTFTSVLLQ